MTTTDVRARTTKTPVATTLATILVSVQLGLMAGGLIYRSTLYHHLPVARGEPYGVGDVLDLLIYFALLGTSALTLGTALVLAAVPRWRSRAAIIALILAGLLPLPIYVLLHARLPRIW